MARGSIAARSIGRTVAEAIADTRRALGWSQAELAGRVGCSQTAISKLERQAGTSTLALIGRTMDELDLRGRLVVEMPYVAAPRHPRDAAHARCVGYVRGRLEAAGWLAATEVEVVDGRSHGSIDLLAFHPATRHLLVIEVKTALIDIGAAERQVAWYQRLAWPAARRLGWRPAAVRSCLLVLATEENAESLLEHRGLFGAAFPVRAPRLRTLIGTGEPETWPAGVRALGLIDPAGRGGHWVRSTPLDGRVSVPRYRDLRDFAARRRHR